MKYRQDYWSDVSRVAANIPNIERLFGKRVVITGATGMVCSAVVDVIVWLNHNLNAEIYPILAGRNRGKITTRFEGVLSEAEFDFVKFDATCAQEITISADYIIHGASNANPAIYSREPVETLLGNVVGLYSMLRLAKCNEGSRLLYISSSEVYGNRLNDSCLPFQEDEYGYVDILNPRACYPDGKRAAETLCACFGEEYAVDTVIVRLGHIYGPSITAADTRASAAFTRDVIAGRDIVMKSAGMQMRSYCYTLDCASAILTVLLNGQTGNAYNISDKNSVASIRDVADAFAAAGGTQVVFENPSDAEKKSYNMMINSALDAEKLETLGWRAEFSLKAGVERTLLYY